MTAVQARVALCAFLCSLSVVLHAQTLEPTQDLRLNVDAARFRGGDNDHSYIEVYYSFPRPALTYVKDSTGFGAGLDVTIIVRQKDSVVYADRWLVVQALQDTSERSVSYNLVGLTFMQLREGEYSFRLIARDRHSPTRQDSVGFTMPVRNVAASAPVMSDIELASMIRQTDQKGQFYKNTLEVIPNVEGLYSEKQRLFYYLEAYNLVREGDSANYRVRTAVFDAVGREVLSKEKPKRKPGESSVIVDQFGIDRLKSGTYALVLSLLDSAGSTLATSGKKFFVYNATLGVDSTLLQASSAVPMTIYLGMGEAELDQEFAWARYEANDDERSNYEKLSGPEPKRKFLSDFWRARPPGKRDEYLARVMFANRMFPVGSRDGFKTDRGRVYIMYGPPDDVDRHPNETDMRPYEIWSFHNIQGGVIFAFVQRTAGGDHELVHSTHRNELRDENWERTAQAR